MQRSTVFRARTLPDSETGELTGFTRQQAGWEWMSFSVNRLIPGDSLEYIADNEEIAIVLLGGICIADWGLGPQSIGARKDVFDGFPYTLYLPHGHKVILKAETLCEIAACRVPSTAVLEPKLVTPADVLSGMRGGENASRQIVDIIRPDFPADKLVAIEVYTPGGNWSSFPPHKHEVHNPPVEVDLDEIYYYRMRDGRGYALQNLYNSRDGEEEIIKARDGDAVLVHDGYHPVVAGPGYDTYYLNFLAGSSRTLSVTEDPEHEWLRSTWKTIDSRLPFVTS